MTVNKMFRKTILIPMVLVLLSWGFPAGPVISQERRGASAESEQRRASQREAEKEGVKRDLLPSTPPRLEKPVDPDSYVLGPYDEMEISVIGADYRSFRVFVLPEGNIFIPGIGSIEADGRTLSEFRLYLAERMGEYFHDVEINCFLVTPRVFKVFVTGEVEFPGAVEVSAVDRVSDAIEKAGDIKSLGSNRRVEVKRDGDVIKVDLLKVILKGEIGKNVFLSNGDAVHVPPATDHVILQGDIRRGGSFEILPGETVSDLIDLAGGFRGEAVTDSVLLSRVVSGDTVETFAIEPDQFNMELRDLDVINVLNRFNTSKRVYVFGAVETEGRFFITEGDKLSNLIARIGGFDPDADLRAASIERDDKSLIRVDMTKYLSGDVTVDVPLRDGDKLYVPRLHRIVAVGGEVKTPGSFDYQGDLTVAHYVGLAGGPTEEGDINRVVIYSPDGSMHKADKDTRPNRGDVIIVKKSMTRLVAEFFSGVIKLGTVVVTIIVLTD